MRANAGSRALAALLLTACTATPYTMPSTDCVPVASARMASWWRSFGDAQLLTVLHEAQRCNVDLAQSALTVSRNRVAVDRADVELKGSLGGKFSHSLEEGPSERSYGARLSVGYELDLWGRLARARDARAWLTAASEFDHQALGLSLEAEVARRYWTLSSLRLRQSLARENVSTQQNMLKIVEAGVSAGALPAREAWLQQQSLLQARQFLGLMQRQAQAASNRVAALLDQAPGVAVDVAPLPMNDLPEIDVGLPVALLARRPDVAAQEARLRQRLAEIDLARAQLMPALSLTGSLGSSSADLGTLLSQPLAVGLASLSLPFLDWRNLDIQRKQARIDFKQESLAYRQTVHRALREVDEALRLRDLLRSEHQHLRQELALARKAEGDAVVRHQAGDVDLLTVYRAQLRRGDLEDRLVSLRFEQLANLADLFQAMGGAPEMIENAPASG